jgi:hypothetical protein
MDIFQKKALKYKIKYMLQKGASDESSASGASGESGASGASGASSSSSSSDGSSSSDDIDIVPGPYNMIKEETSDRYLVTLNSQPILNDKKLSREKAQNTANYFNFMFMGIPKIIKYECKQQYKIPYDKALKLLIDAQIIAEEGQVLSDDNKLKLVQSFFKKRDAEREAKEDAEREAYLGLPLTDDPFDIELNLDATEPDHGLLYLHDIIHVKQ